MLVFVVLARTPYSMDSHERILVKEGRFGGLGDVLRGFERNERLATKSEDFHILKRNTPLIAHVSLLSILQDSRVTTPSCPILQFLQKPV